MNNLRINHTVHHWTFGWAGPVAFSVFGGVVLWACLPVAVPAPESREVSEASGRVEAVQSIRGGVYFRLREPNLGLVLHSKSGHLGVLQSAFATSPAASYTVRYRNSEPTSPLFMSGNYYAVLSVAVNGKAVLSEQQVLDGSANDNLIGVALGGAFVALGLALAIWLAAR